MVLPIIRPWWSGDFASMLADAWPQWEKARKGYNDQSHVDWLAVFQIAVLDESGETLRLGELLDDYARRAPGLIRDESADDLRSAIVLDARRRAGRISEEDFIAARAAAVAASKSSPVWLGYYALPARSAADAREALAALPSFAPLGNIEGDITAQWLVGRVDRLAGDLDRAVANLRGAVRTCFSLDLSHYHRLRAAAELGEALEAKGDVGGACEAYGIVLARWGGARPRSVTADLARRRSRALQCPSLSR